jgi:inhibitor of KinA
MGDVPAELALERLRTPRTRIPAGSVAIAANMCCIFPRETPCGWHIIGRCPIPLWDQRHSTAVIAPGDKIIFEPISVQDYSKLERITAESGFELLPVPEDLGTAP